MLIKPNDPSSSFWSSLVGFENQSFSSQFANRIRLFLRFDKVKLTVISFNFLAQGVTDSLAISLAAASRFREHLSSNITVIASVVLQPMNQRDR